MYAAHHALLLFTGRLRRNMKRPIDRQVDRQVRANVTTKIILSLMSRNKGL